MFPYFYRTPYIFGEEEERISARSRGIDGLRLLRELISEFVFFFFFSPFDTVTRIDSCEKLISAETRDFRYRDIET